VAFDLANWVLHFVQFLHYPNGGWHLQ